jgi:hypothetical protein
MNTIKITWNHQVIQGHTMKARVNKPLLIPPGNGVGYMLRVGAKITI